MAQLASFITALGTGVRALGERTPLQLVLRRRRKTWPGHDERYGYQSRLVTFALGPGSRVLDLGSGGYPFPHASVLVDRFPSASPSRSEPLVRNGKPLVIADAHALPFPDQCFDFVYCSHLLEHLEDPSRACGEIMRVGKRGYIEAPTLGKDALFAWAEGLHRWHVIACGSTLCFFEYTARQLAGIRCSAWRDIILSRWDHPLQAAFYQNPEIFNVIFPWEGGFQVFVFRLDGSVERFPADQRGEQCVF